MTAGDPNITIVYDGDCPFCSAYVRMVRLRRAVGDVVLLDAREGGPVVAGLWEAGYDLDQGMAMLIGGEVHYGADCIHRMALLSTPSDWFNRLNAVILRSRTASKFLYPVLRFCRNTALRFRGRPPLTPMD